MSLEDFFKLVDQLNSLIGKSEANELQERVDKILGPYGYMTSRDDENDCFAIIPYFKAVK